MTPPLSRVFLVREATTPGWTVRNSFPSPDISLIPTWKLPAGKEFYHGTAACEKFKIPRGPAHFTENFRMARTYAVEESYSESDGRTCPRVIVLHAHGSPKVVHFPSVQDRESMTIAVTTVHSLTDVLLSNLGHQRQEKISEALTKMGMDGYYQEKIDGGGSDLMLLEPEKWLTFVRDENIQV